MKRIPLIISVFGLVLTGCASMGADKQAATSPAEAIVSVDSPQALAAEPNGEAMENTPIIDTAQISAAHGSESAAMPLDYEALTEPPVLTVSTWKYVDSATVFCGNYHWSDTLPDGTATELLACGAHPLDQQEHPIVYTAFHVGVLPFSEDDRAQGSMDPILYLDFGEISPETVSAVRWPASCIGDAQSHSTDFETVTTEFDKDAIMLLPLSDGDYVYEVTAEWGKAGGGSYTFRTVPGIRGAQADELTEIFDALNELEYQPYTCDGLPEYLLIAADGTVYSINFSEKWVWRGNNEQAELTDELIGQLKEKREGKRDHCYE